MNLLKQSTAVTLLIGPFVDSTDGNTAETALTISQADVRLSKNGGNMAQKGEATSCTHDEIGYYTCPLNTTDTGTLGILKLMVHESGSLPVWHEYLVVPANVYDSLVGGTDYLQTDAVQIEGSDATDQINAACDTAMTDYDAVVPADLPTNFADLSITATTGRVDVAAIAGTSQTANDNGADINAILADTNELQTDDIPGTLTTIEGKIDTIDGIVDSILVDTGEIGAAGAGLTAVPWNASWDAEVQSECADALTAYDPPTKTELDTAFTEIKGVTWSSGSDTLEHIRDKQTDIETDTQDLQTQIGTDGAGLTSLPWNASWDAEVQSECTDALNAYDPPTKAELDSGLAGLNDITADDVWDATSATLSTSFEVLIDRIYQMTSNKMTVNESTGAAALRNVGDTGDIATGSVVSSSGTTTRAELSWT